MLTAIFFILAINIGIVMLWFAALSRLDAYAGRSAGHCQRLKFFFAGWLSLPVVLLLYWLSWAGPVAALTVGLDGIGTRLVQEFLITGPVEESAKFAVFFVLARATRSVRDPRDGILQAASVGLAFAFIENIKYCFEFGPLVLYYRAFFCVLGHLSYAAIWGFAYAQATARFGDGPRTNLPVFRHCLVALVPAAFIHGLSNFLLGTPAYSFAGIYDLAGMWAAIGLYCLSGRDSPLNDFPLKDWRTAVRVIGGFLERWPGNPELSRRRAFYLLYGRQALAARDSFAQALEYCPADHYLRIFHGVAGFLATGDEATATVMRQALAATRVPHKRIRLAVRRFVADDADRNKVLDVLFPERGDKRAAVLGRPPAEPLIKSIPPAS
jgi:RsiW-degrading membrane proteinase PrsW (M82 family)